MGFSIRDLLLVTVIVAILLAWWVDHRQQRMRAESLVKAERATDDRFTALRNIVELDGSKVNWELKENGEMHLSVETPAPKP